MGTTRTRKSSIGIERKVEDTAFKQRHETVMKLVKMSTDLLQAAKYYENRNYKGADRNLKACKATIRTIRL